MVVRGLSFRVLCASSAESQPCLQPLKAWSSDCMRTLPVSQSRSTRTPMHSKTSRRVPLLSQTSTRCGVR